MALPSLDRDAVDPGLYRRACATEGYFTLNEASLLIRAIQSSGPSPTYLEIGSFRGRSTMFALAAMPRLGRVISVDAFVYAEHSPAELRATLSDPRVSILEGTTIDNWTALAACHPNVVLVDADHSFAGASLDLALVLALAPVGGLLATHDVSDRFPGVKAAVAALAGYGVLAHAERADNLVVWTVRSRPGWLIDPQSESDWELPDDMEGTIPMVVQLAKPDRRPARPADGGSESDM